MFISRSLIEPYYQDGSKLEADLKIAAASSPEDKRLFEWLSQEDDVWPSLAQVFQRRAGTRKGFEAWLLHADHRQYDLSADLRRVGAFFVVIELREFGGHTLWNRIGKIPHYEDILKAVHDRVSETYGIAKRKSMAVEEREMSLASILLKEGLENLSPDAMQEILKEANFETTSDYQEFRKGLLGKLAGNHGTDELKITLGKKLAKRFGISLVEKAFRASSVANAGPIGALASRILPLAARRAGLYLSIGFFLKDAYQLGGEATRITNPAVIIISLYRSLSVK